MPAASDYVTGTLSVTNGSINFTGTSTGWLLAGFKEGDTIIDITGATEYMGVIATIDANGAGTLTKVWEGPTLVDVAYRMRYQPDGARVSAQARNLIELLGNGNLQAFAGLSGSANQVPIFTGPGAMTLVSKTDLVSGANYDVQVADLAARAAYDGQAAGYSVLVADTGDGRAAIYSKVSATSGDWSDPAYVTGPIGPLPDVTIGTVTTGDPGSAAQVTATPTVDGVELDFTIPAGEGFAFQGAYSGATTYVLGDVAQESGSSWILTVAESTGNAPPALPTTSNAYWQLLARQGTDGAGTVDSIAAGAGISVDNTDPTAPVVSIVAFTGDSGSGGTLGGVPAPAAGDADKFLKGDGGWGAPALAAGTNLLINPLGTINQRTYTSGAATSGANQYTLDRWRVVVSGQALSWTESEGVRTITAPVGGVEQVVEGAAILTDDYVLNWEGTATATVNGTARAKGEVFSLIGGVNVTVRFLGGTFAKPQLERGASATDFALRHIQQELALCQRYFTKLTMTLRGYSAGAPISSWAQLPVNMRASPSISSAGAPTATSNVSSEVYEVPTPTGFRFNLIAAAAGDTFTLERPLNVDAEL